MAHAKIVRVHDAVLLTALRAHLNLPAVSPLAGSLMQAVQAHVKDDAAEVGGLPPDAHVTGHNVDASGQVSLIVESAAWPWTPDGLPLDKLQPWIPPAARIIVTPEAAE